MRESRPRGRRSPPRRAARRARTLHALPRRDAVALSKDLATDGYKVQVRRAAGANAQAPRPAEKRPVPAVSNGDTLYRVRVGSFADRATAMTTLKELEAKGYKPFIARGGS